MKKLIVMMIAGAISILSELAKTWSIRFYVVLAYPPTEKDTNYLAHTVLPDGIETVPPRFAINYRNRFMIENADFVITYFQYLQRFCLYDLSHC